MASGACSSEKPNFEPAWPVRIAAWVSATTPGVTRIITSAGRASCSSLSSSSKLSTTIRAPASRGGLQLASGLRVAVEDDPLAGEARLLGQRELAAGGDVDAQPLLVEDAQDGRAREGLGGEHDLALPHRGRELAGAVAQVVLGDDVHGRAELAGELDRVAAADRQAAVADLRSLGVEVAHGGGHVGGRC